MKNILTVAGFVLLATASSALLMYNNIALIQRQAISSPNDNAVNLSYFNVSVVSVLTMLTVTIALVYCVQYFKEMTPRVSSWALGMCYASSALFLGNLAVLLLAAR